jgi:hypothetical protein
MAAAPLRHVRPLLPRTRVGAPTPRQDMHCNRLTGNSLLFRAQLCKATRSRGIRLARRRIRGRVRSRACR